MAFPSAPTNGDVYVDSTGAEYEYIAANNRWKKRPPSSAGLPGATQAQANAETSTAVAVTPATLGAHSRLSQAALDGRYVNATGDTMTGDLVMTAGNRVVNMLGAVTSAGVLDWNDDSNTRGGTGVTLLKSTTSVNGPGAGDAFHHPLNLRFGSTSNTTQIAVPYHQDPPNDVINARTFFYRTRYLGTWSAWEKLWSTGNHGAGSGLDADKLDGLEATAFATATHNHDTAYVPLARTVTAGTGLTGGGALSGNITISASLSSNAQALAGTDNTTLMTPLRVKEALDAAALDWATNGF